MRICILLLIFSHIIYFFSFYLTENVLLQDDLIFLTIPLKFEAARMWREGVIPFWDDKISNGVPLIANPTSSALYPLIIPLIIFPNLKVYTLLSLFHHFLFLFGIFLFSYYILKNPWYSLFFCIFLGYNGIILRFFTFSNPLFGISFLPWFLLFFYKYLINSKKINLILSSILFSLSIFSGFDLSPFLFSFSLLLLTLFIDYKKLLSAFFCIFLAFLLSAPQTLSTLNYLPYTQRGMKAPYEGSTGFFSLNPLRVFEIFIPSFNGMKGSFPADMSWDDALCEEGRALYPNIYFGMVSLFFLFSLRPLKKKWLLFFFTISFLLLSFGKYFPLHAYISKLPLISLIRYPEKFLVFVLIFFYIYFLFTLKEFKKISIFPSLALSLALISFILLNRTADFTLINKYINFSSFQPKNPEMYLMEIFLLIALFISFFFFLFLYFLKKRASLFYILVLFSYLDLYYGTYTTLSPKPPEALNLPLVRDIKSTGNGRLCSNIYSYDFKYLVPEELTQDFLVRSLSPHLGILFGIPYAFSPLIDNMHPVKASVIKKEDLDLWGVSHIISAGKKVVKGKWAIFMSKEFSVTLYNEKPTYLWFISKENNLKYPLEMPKYKNPSMIELNIKNEKDGILWLGFNSLPGWKIFVNGIKKDLAREDLEGLNVFLQKGENKVKFVYTPPGLGWGLFLFFLGLLFIFIFLKLKLSIFN
ncbi:MAG: hypothetical protein WHV67_01670 [Thermoanaerobaculia bacterium]